MCEFRGRQLDSSSHPNIPITEVGECARRDRLCERYALAELHPSSRCTLPPITEAGECVTWGEVARLPDREWPRAAPAPQVRPLRPATASRLRFPQASPTALITLRGTRQSLRKANLFNNMGSSSMLCRLPAGRSAGPQCREGSHLVHYRRADLGFCLSLAASHSPVRSRLRSLRFAIFEVDIEVNIYVHLLT